MPMFRARFRGVFLLAGLSLALVAGGASARAASPAASGGAARPSADDTAQARAVLRETSTALREARTLRFEVRSLVPVRSPDGGWITLSGVAKVTRSGRDKLFVETGGDLYHYQLFFDGKAVTAFAPEAKAFARKPAPGTTDEMLQQAERNGEAAFLFADLVSADPYAAMTSGLVSAHVVGLSTLDGVETRHVAVHGQKLDWEIWIGTQDRLPRMVTLTDPSDAHRPTKVVRLSEWAVNQEIPADTFAFNAPADAIQIPFHKPEQLRAAARRGATPTPRP
jgi:hypothetical protein